MFRLRALEATGIGGRGCAFAVPMNAMPTHAESMGPARAASNRKGEEAGKPLFGGTGPVQGPALTPPGDSAT